MGELVSELVSQSRLAVRFSVDVMCMHVVSERGDKA